VSKVGAHSYLVSGIRKDRLEDSHLASMMVLDTSVAGKVQDRQIAAATEGENE
jgi:hypothetical protein